MSKRIRRAMAQIVSKIWSLEGSASRGSALPRARGLLPRVGVVSLGRMVAAAVSFALAASIVVLGSPTASWAQGSFQNRALADWAYSKIDQNWGECIGFMEK